MTEDRRIEVNAAPAKVLAAAEEVARQWGADWERMDGVETAARLGLPVIAGIRRGHLVGRLSFRPQERGSEVSFAVEEAHYAVNRSAAVVLVIGGVGAVLAMLWPFFPVLLGIAPFAAIMAVAAWLLVVSRLRSSGIEEYLGQVRDRCEPSKPAG